MSDHASALEYLVYNLKEVNEFQRDTLYIIREGIYIPEDRMIEFPDIILIKKDRRGIPIELKTGLNRHLARPKALHQLENGKDFILKELRLKCEYGKLVFTN